MEKTRIILGQLKVDLQAFQVVSEVGFTARTSRKNSKKRTVEEIYRRKFRNGTSRIFVSGANSKTGHENYA